MATGPPPKPFPASKLLRASPSVNPPKEDLDRLRHKSEPTAATYDWLRAVPEYNKWLNATSGLPILAITGVPGSGKTCVAISWASVFGHMQSQDRVASAYYFCDGKDKGRSSGTAVLRGLLYQLCNANIKTTIPNQLLQRAWEAWVTEDKGDDKAQLPSSDGNRDQDQWWNNFDSLWALFKEIVAHPDTGNFILLIDAVDEYEESTRGILLSRLSRFQADWRRNALQGNVKVLLTCRKIQDLGMTRMEYRHIRLKTGPENTLLGPYIRESIETMFKHCHFEPEFTKAKISQIQRTSEGTFLWVSFLLSDLRNICLDGSISRHEKRTRIEKSIQSMPLELAEKYDQILDDIGKGDFSETSTILQILGLATRPMTKAEVKMAFELIKMPWNQVRYPTGDTWSKEDEEHMYESCADLVHVYIDAAKRETVSLVHQSLKQHLLHLDRHYKKKLLSYVGINHVVVKCAAHAMELTRFGLEIYQATTGVTHESHILVLRAFFSACYLANLCLGCLLFLRERFVGAGHQSFNMWKAFNFGARQHLLTVEHSLENTVGRLLISVVFTTLVVSWAMNRILTMVVIAFPCVANWAKPAELKSLFGLTIGILPIATVFLLLEELSQLVGIHWESTNGSVVTRRRANRLLWEVCAKRMILFFAGLAGKHAWSSSRTRK